MTDGGSEKKEQPALADHRDTETVYQPAEDSHLLAETAIQQVESGAVTLGPETRGLDVGTGSGYVAASLHDAVGIQVVGIDINPNACKQARETAIPVVRGDMFDPFSKSVFDVILCNPPYLPTPPEQEWDDWMERALSGGEDGRAVVDPFLEGVGRVLGPDGVAFLLISTLTGPDEVRAFAREQGLDSAVVGEQSHPFEKLLVVRFTPQ